MVHLKSEIFINIEFLGSNRMKWAFLISLCYLFLNKLPNEESENERFIFCS